MTMTGAMTGAGARDLDADAAANDAHRRERAPTPGGEPPGHGPTFGLLAFHGLAAARGDGLHEKLLDLMRAAARIATDPDVVPLEATRDGFAQAGPCPAAKMPEFLPKNVVRLESKAGKAGSANAGKENAACTSP